MAEREKELWKADKEKEELPVYSLSSKAPAIPKVKPIMSLNCEATLHSNRYIIATIFKEKKTTITK